MGVCKPIWQWPMKLTLILFNFLLAFLVFTCLFNIYQVKPSEIEIIALKKFYGDKINIENLDDILLLQNYTIDNISHYSSGVNEINVVKTLKTKKGYCFHRSLIMQKVMLYNGIEVRPVFLFSNPFQKSTSIYDFFSAKVYTHSIFQFNWEGTWYTMETNNRISKPLCLNQYLTEQKIFKVKPKYILYLNNRNGKFIYPSWIPDIY